MERKPEGEKKSRDQDNHKVIILLHGDVAREECISTSTKNRQKVRDRGRSRAPRIDDGGTARESRHGPCGLPAVSGAHKPLAFKATPPPLARIHQRARLAPIVPA